VPKVYMHTGRRFMERMILGIGAAPMAEEFYVLAQKVA
jgi:hypothetical protein